MAEIKEKLKTLKVDGKLYPRAHDNRLPISHSLLKGPRKGFLKAAFKSFLSLQILFLALFAYLFGAIFAQSGRIHKMNIVFVDYDGGAIGESFRQAYSTLKNPSFPTLEEQSPSVYETVGEVRHDVCKIDYWGAIYIAPNASSELEAALASGSNNYDKTNMVFYIWNEARYSAVIDSSISANLQTLSQAARIAYSHRNFTDITLSPSTLPIVADPWHLTSDNIQSTTQGARLVYNTLVIILVLIQEFFYLGTINALYEGFNIYSRLNPHRIIIFRFFLSLAYCLIGALCVSGIIWAYRSSWDVNAAQFFLTWAVLWLFAHLNFLTLDVFTVWLPPPFIPMALISWVIMNASSVLVPFELSNGFYKWGYMLPAHAVYNTLVDIWSRGCNPQLYYTLPVLFSFEISSFVLSALGVHRRSHYAVIKEEQEAEAFQGRIDTAMDFERKKARERRENDERVDEEEGEDKDEEEGEDKDREELSRAITREMSRVKRVQSASKVVGFGPSFGPHFVGSDE
ncbi:hypothetical protein BJ875DRAFT_535170 [Amylocarpus encephaloides]|uniref:DUF3533 domain-containing protein n=1 Tax=Amylocarpus encephaloides TaxID=45428 RepID=A0A9P8C537_9HELO|nr:hypothetical protein BJ875DRAFT_535170 [Amylocarpus encephaloides]